MLDVKHFGFPIIMSLTLLGCDKQPEVNATCSSPETQAKVSSEISVEVEKQLREIKDDYGNYMYDEAKIRASLAQVEVTLDKVITVKEDPNSSKKFCKGNLKLNVPTPMLEEIKEAGKLFSQVKLQRAIPYSYVEISQYARELNIMTSANVFTKEGFQYGVQPTDDKKEIFLEMENSTVIPMLHRVTEMALLKPMLELKKAEQASQETEIKAQEKKQQQEIEKLQQEANEAKQKALLENEKRKLKDEKNQAGRGEVAQENSKAANLKDSGKSRIAFSEKMGVDVYATGSKWCKQAIDLTVKIDDFSPLVDSSEMLAFIPKLKAPIEGECRPAAIANITVVDSKGDAIGYYKSYKANDWYPEIVEKE